MVRVINGSITPPLSGTSSGFGRRLAKIVLSRGDRVIATVRSLDRPKPLTEEIDPNWRDRLRMMQLDVLEGIESLKKKGEEANGYWGRIDVLVNNAGACSIMVTRALGIDDMVTYYIHTQDWGTPP